MQKPPGATAVAYLSSDIRPLGRAQKASRYDRWGKRALDLALGLPLMVLAAPVIAVLWSLIRLDGGSGFFAHSRVGRDGRRIRCVKLRSMVPEAEARLSQILASDPDAAAEWAECHKLRRDPRVTRIGHFLRRTCLDELPQLWSVVRGELSLVGPRPITAEELRFYDPDRHVYLDQTPGLTGLWQVQARGSACYRRRVALDREYYLSGGMGIDLGIILRTALRVFGLD